MANIYANKILIEYDTVEVYLSKDLLNIVNMADLEKFAISFNRLDKNIPTMSFHPTEDTLDPAQKIAKSIALSQESASKLIQQIFIAYKPGESYALGNVVGKVFASNSGLILLNDIRIAQAYDYHKGFIANLIIHEILHVYGLDHADGLGLMVKNKPVMSLGKSSPIGISFDDQAGLFENYSVAKKRTMAHVEFDIEGDVAVLLNRDNPNNSQAKNIKNGKVIFPYALKGKYTLFVDGVKIKNLKVR